MSTDVRPAHFVATLDNDRFTTAIDQRRRAREFLVSQRLDDAYNTFLRRVFAARVAEHPILGGIETTTTEHGGPVRNVVTGPTPVDTPMVTAVAEGSYAIADVEKPDFAGHKRFVNDIIEQMIGIQLTHMFDAIGKIATAVGNVTDGNGPLTLDLFRESIRKIELDFDDDGRAKMPQLVTSPEWYERTKAIVEQAQRDPELVRIVLEKRDAFLARRQKRRIY
jgi:hypothetical protein